MEQHKLFKFDLPESGFDVMRVLTPPTYICMPRTSSEFMLDGKLSKEKWGHVPFSKVFVDISNISKELPETHFKMMYDEYFVYVGAELIESKLWGTYTKKNEVMYHENDFEIFFNPSMTRHYYYEFEMNCLNTIWELALNRPYKDGNDIINPYNLAHTESAVHTVGEVNSPGTTSVKWSLEVKFARKDLKEFNKMKDLKEGDFWRVNFSRVQYELFVENGKYEKDLTKKEENIVWSPTGKVDIHLPEMWGYVFFSSSNDFDIATKEFDAAYKLQEERRVMERILDTIYYQQISLRESEGEPATSIKGLFKTRSSHVDVLTSSVILRYGINSLRIDQESKTHLTTMNYHYSLSMDGLLSVEKLHCLSQE